MVQRALKYYTRTYGEMKYSRVIKIYASIPAYGKVRIQIINLNGIRKKNCFEYQILQYRYANESKLEWNKTAFQRLHICVFMRNREIRIIRIYI